MERGTDWELEALRERWDAMERDRELADRLVYGMALLGTGVLLLLLSVPARVCDHGDGVAGTICTAVEKPAVAEAILVILGVATLVGGSWLCWRVLGGQPRDRLAALGLS